MSGRPGQEAPPADLDIAAFPTKELHSTDLLYRSHGMHGYGYFSSTSAASPGRFDLPEPAGTMYAGDHLRMVIWERFGTQARDGISAADASSFQVSSFTGVEGTFADVSTEDAQLHGVTGELTSMREYDIPQQWAQRFFEGGRDGIRYSPRFTPGNSSAWAIYGESGPQDVGTRVELIPGAEACARAGVKVAPGIPHTPGSVTVI